MCGDVTWEQGAILKGTGLCHGISGNACLLHSLYRKFTDLAKQEIDIDVKKEHEVKAEKWKTRVYFFIKMICDDRVREQCEDFNDQS